MSDLANQEREVKQRWAVPGSSHDRIVRFAKVALPSAVGVVIAFLAMAPLDKSGDVSFILDKNQVENAPERMRVEQARYVGQDNNGQKFLIVANRALQRTSEQPIVDIWGMLARFGLAQGPVTVAANQGQYNLDQQKVTVQGAILVPLLDVYRRESVGVNTRNARSRRADAPLHGMRGTESDHPSPSPRTPKENELLLLRGVVQASRG